MEASARVIRGIPASPGLGVGPLVRLPRRVAPPVDEPAPVTLEDGVAEVAAVLEQVAQGMEARAEGATEAAQAILRAGALIARDPDLADLVRDRIAGGLGVSNAVAAAADSFAAQLESLGGLMAERAADVRDVRDRAVARLLGQPESGVPRLGWPFVLTADEVSPAEAATLDPALCLALVTAGGGPTSHTAILAAQLGIPAVVGARGIETAPERVTVAVDGGRGEVEIDPSPARLEQLRTREDARKRALEGFSGRGATKDGHPVPLLANLGALAEAVRLGAWDVEGVGLFRTEFLFMDRDRAPSVGEQEAIYRRLFNGIGGLPVTVRTLDAGADQPLRFADLGLEDNPALGQRGIRTAAKFGSLLDDQLAALAQAAERTGADVRVMAPMVATEAEAEWFAGRARACGLSQVGVMVETPAAALQADRILRQVDFVSIGSNDLAQYTMAADRLQPELAGLLDPWQPAVLQLIGLAAEAGGLTGKPVGLCGEAGGDPALALVLIGLGVTSLSMAPPKIAAVRAALASHDLRHCRDLAAVALAAPTPAAAKQAVLDAAAPILRALT
ncbi:MAG: phosphoenolpyruvate--protein phosphotransferase [Bifidobacteriaceae bacterium]|jgi:phosphotransferase system enzyme I (PtsI)|nr:phosphoenolpyruvate--protein phosphotransferase [Bifidobacteriaceae bacterium]